MLKHACIYFVVSLVLEFVVLWSGNRILTMILLLPGLIVSFLISHSSDTSDLSFIIGLLWNAAICTSAVLLIEDTLRRRKT